MKAIASREAIAKLGLLRQSAEATIASLIPDPMVEHPRAICLTYRKAGEQISTAEKKHLGIRPNGYMSTTACSELSDAGRPRALKAHEITLLRATFAYKRYADALAARTLPAKADAIQLKFDVSQPGCPVCDGMDGMLLKIDGSFILPPAGCECETANYRLSPNVDWLADLD